jgi:hypothetical protein
MCHRLARWGVWLVLLFCIAPDTQAQTPALTLHVGSAQTGWPVVVQVGPILDDQALQGALDSALPLRFHLRVELWRKGVLDRLVAFDEVAVALLRDPLEAGFTLESGSYARRIGNLAEAQQALAGMLRSDLRPDARGAHYYLATLEVETLSLSDLDELRRWLRGDVGPAVEGRAPVSRAVERGLRRLMIRVIGLPTRRFEARTGTFDVS